MVIFLFFADSTWVDLSGEKVINLSLRRILSGSPPGFYPYFYRDEHLSLKIKGSLYGRIELEGEIYQGRLPQEERAGVTGRWSWGSAFLGDFEGNMGNLVVGKRLRGIKGEIFPRILFLSGFYSILRGKHELERFSGDGTQGPFELLHSSIIVGSERVRVGEGLSLELMERGKDYLMDYERGRITFKRIIKPEETVEIEYEYLEEGEGRVLYGVDGGIKTKILTLGYSRVKGGFHEFHGGIEYKGAGVSGRLSLDTLFHRSWSLTGKIKAGWVSMDGGITWADSGYANIGKHIERNVRGRIGLNPFEWMRFSGDYARREDTEEKGWSYEVKYLGYSSRIYSGSKKRRVRKVYLRYRNFEIHAGREERDTLAFNTVGGKLSLRMLSFSMQAGGEYRKGKENEWEGNISGNFTRSIFSIGGGVSIILSSIRLHGDVRFTPLKFLRAQGRYEIETRRRDSLPFKVHTGILNLTFNPSFLTLAWRPSFRLMKNEEGFTPQRSWSNVTEVGLSPWRFLNTGYVDERNRFYYLEENGRLLQDNREERNNWRLRFSPSGGISCESGISRGKRRGIFPRFFPTEEDTAGDTVTVYEEEEKWLYYTGFTLIFTEGRRIKGRLRFEDYKKEMPDSVPYDYRTLGADGGFFAGITSFLSMGMDLGYEYEYGIDPRVSKIEEVRVGRLLSGISFSLTGFEYFRADAGFREKRSFIDSRQVLRETRLELRSSYENFELTGNLKHTHSFSPDYSTLEAKAGVRIRF